jgi:hypothetical protein
MIDYDGTAISPAEEIYNEEIRPLLRQANEIALANKMPFGAFCEFEPNSLAGLVNIEQASSAEAEFLQICVRAGGDLEKTFQKVFDPSRPYGKVAKRARFSPLPFLIDNLARAKVSELVDSPSNPRLRQAYIDSRKGRLFKGPLHRAFYVLWGYTLGRDSLRAAGDFKGTFKVAHYVQNFYAILGLAFLNGFMLRFVIITIEKSLVVFSQ